MLVDSLSTSRKHAKQVGTEAILNKWVFMIYQSVAMVA